MLEGSLNVDSEKEFEAVKLDRLGYWDSHLNGTVSRVLSPISIDMWD